LRITLVVYDILGNEIITLVNKNLSVGSYEFTFDASGLSSGVYFYQFRVYPAKGRAGSFVETKKMVLIH
jgi:hypothetical protein